MTRINANVPVEKLVNKHLLVEFYEITRVTTQLAKRLAKGKGLPKNMPQQFKLGTGHVTFFLDKGLYLHKRYDKLLAELLRRNFNITKIFDWAGFYADKQEYYNDYDMTLDDNQVLIDRLKVRLLTMKNLKYYDQKIDYDFAVKLLHEDVHKTICPSTCKTEYVFASTMLKPRQ